MVDMRSSITCPVVKSFILSERIVIISCVCPACLWFFLFLSFLPSLDFCSMKRKEEKRASDILLNRFSSGPFSISQSKGHHDRDTSSHNASWSKERTLELTDDCRPPLLKWVFVLLPPSPLIINPKLTDIRSLCPLFSPFFSSFLLFCYTL